MDYKGILMDACRVLDTINIGGVLNMNRIVNVYSMLQGIIQDIEQQEQALLREEGEK